MLSLILLVAKSQKVHPHSSLPPFGDLPAALLGSPGGLEVNHLGNPLDAQGHGHISHMINPSVQTSDLEVILSEFPGSLTIQQRLERVWGWDGLVSVFCGSAEFLQQYQSSVFKHSYPAEQTILRMAPTLWCISLGAPRCRGLTTHLSRESYMWLKSIWAIVFSFHVVINFGFVCLKQLSELIMDIDI